MVSPFVRSSATTCAVVLTLLLSKQNEALVANSKIGTLPRPWRSALINYSGANEYMRSHYRGQLRHPYFDKKKKKKTKEDEEARAATSDAIYNARHGIVRLRNNEIGEEVVRASLEDCGFVLVADANVPLVDSFQSREQIQSIYLPHLRQRILPQVFPNDTILETVFWFPVVRGEVYQGANPKENVISRANIVGSAHIDTDVAAYDTLEDLVHLVFQNVVSDKDPQVVSQQRREVLACLEKGHRFAIVNFWRNTDTLQPIERNPLALFATTYETSDATTDGRRRNCLPDCPPDMARSRWYCFPNMTFQECLVFSQYDRDITRPSDVWHCAIGEDANDNDDQDKSNDNQRERFAGMNGAQARPRQSFDVRALVVFQEKVSPENDRFTTGSLQHFKDEDDL